MRTGHLEFLDTPARHVLAAVERAAHLARRIRENAVVPVSKPDRTPLTIADLAVQALISRALEREFPEDVLLAEEDGAVLHTAAGQELAAPLLHYLQPLMPDITLEELTRLLNRGRRTPAARTWVLDPIDGTKGFLRDAGHYVVALALLTANRPALGMLACPTLEADGSAPLEQGGARLLAQGCAVVSVASTHTDPKGTDEFMRLAGIETPANRVDSQAKHALVAAGHAELFFRIPADSHYREQVWDHAAGALIVTEAGGRVTDLTGKPLDFSAGARLLHNEGILVSNGILHAPALLALRSVQLRQR